LFRTRYGVLATTGVALIAWFGIALGLEAFL